MGGRCRLGLGVIGLLGDGDGRLSVVENKSTYIWLTVRTCVSHPLFRVVGTEAEQAAALNALEPAGAVAARRLLDQRKSIDIWVRLDVSGCFGEDGMIFNDHERYTDITQRLFGDNICTNTTHATTGR